MKTPLQLALSVVAGVLSLVAMPVGAQSVLFVAVQGNGKTTVAEIQPAK